jgi:hypothetical protein
MSTTAISISMSPTPRSCLRGRDCAISLVAHKHLLSLAVLLQMGAMK